MMKISKLLKVGAFALLAASLCFVGCKKEDDEENAIDGNTINYTNTSTTDIYRAYISTNFKHHGELVKITFNNQTATSHDGVMGFIWDYQEAKSVDGSYAKTNSVSDTYNFFVIGFNGFGATGNVNGPRFYISKFFNVPKGKLDADNFGASSSSDIVTEHAAGIAASTPKEIEVQSWKALDKTKVKIADDKTLTFWVDIYPVYSGSTYGVDIASHSSDAAGSFVVDIYNSDPRESGATKLDTVVIPTSQTGYTAKPAQAYLAKYANVQPNKTLSGTWTFAKDYAEDEVVEE